MQSVQGRSIDWLFPGHTWTKDQTHNLGMRSDWELNPPTLVTEQSSNQLSHTGQGYRTHS